MKTFREIAEAKVEKGGLRDQIMNGKIHRNKKKIREILMMTDEIKFQVRSDKPIKTVKTSKTIVDRIIKEIDTRKGLEAAKMKIDVLKIYIGFWQGHWFEGRINQERLN